MTVAELIQKLQDFDPDTKVLVWDPYWDDATETVVVSAVVDNYAAKVLICNIDFPE